jgi:hypothetical protein
MLSTELQALMDRKWGLPASINREETKSGITLLIQLGTYLERRRNKSELISSTTMTMWEKVRSACFRHEALTGTCSYCMRCFEKWNKLLNYTLCPTFRRPCDLPVRLCMPLSLLGNSFFSSMREVSTLHYRHLLSRAADSFSSFFSD